ncbi:MAG: BBP7 family outer membrane beta-barrel protein [Planctomycetia bacterium]
MRAHRFGRSILIAATIATVSCLQAGARHATAAEAYAVVDALFLQRDNESKNRTLVIDNVTSQPAITSTDLRFPVGSGVRAFVGHHGCGERGWEVGYIGVYGMSAVDTVAGNGTLDIAPPLSARVASFSGASLAEASYGSAINGAEANLLATSEHYHLPRLTAYAAEQVPYVAMVDWLAGFRWAGLEEQAAIALATPGLGTSRYAVRSSSNLFGGQVGVRGRIDWERWGLEGQAKAALAGVELSQSQAPVVDANTGEVYRAARGARGSDVGGIFDWNVTVVRHINDVWSIRAGYTMLWLTGVALAPNQFDFSTSTAAGTTVVGESSIWLQGATLGLEGRW